MDGGGWSKSKLASVTTELLRLRHTRHYNNVIERFDMHSADIRWLEWLVQSSSGSHIRQFLYVLVKRD